jgi:hypothetical protein
MPMWVDHNDETITAQALHDTTALTAAENAMIKEAIKGRAWSCRGTSADTQ